MKACMPRSCVRMIVVAVVLLASTAYAAPFTWTISGTAESGHWDLNDLAGRDYVLSVTTDSAAPDQNNFNGFGTYGNLPATIDIQGLGTRVLGNFTFIEQFSTATSDRLRVRGPDNGPETVLQIPVGTLGDPDTLSVWGPVQTIGTGVTFRIFDPGNDPNPSFQLFDTDTASSGASKITISTSVAQVPEISLWRLLLLAFAMTGFVAWMAERQIL